MWSWARVVEPKEQGVETCAMRRAEEKVGWAGGRAARSLCPHKGQKRAGPGARTAWQLGQDMVYVRGWTQSYDIDLI